MTERPILFSGPMAAPTGCVVHCSAHPCEECADDWARQQETAAALVAPVEAGADAPMPAGERPQG